MDTQAQSAVEPGPSKAEKTMAEVSDRALDLLEKSVTSVAAGVEKAAPQVWRVAVRQQYAKAIGPLVLPWGVFISGFIIAFWLYRKARAWLHSDAAWNESPLPLIVSLGLAVSVLIPMLDCFAYVERFQHVLDQPRVVRLVGPDQGASREGCVGRTSPLFLGR